MPRDQTQNPVTSQGNLAGPWLLGSSKEAGQEPTNPSPGVPGKIKTPVTPVFKIKTQIRHCSRSKNIQRIQIFNQCSKSTDIQRLVAVEYFCWLWGSNSSRPKLFTKGNQPEGKNSGPIGHKKVPKRINIQDCQGMKTMKNLYLWSRRNFFKRV